GYLFNVEVTVEESTKDVKAKGLETPKTPLGLQYSAADESGVAQSSGISRNAPCPCGSGKKYKRCHGEA
ncbi:MAG: hypothetical protein F2767_04760, partial [Actinobacteria bacterium]|nr:hypothetical protein [Actinomycetota bacterium]